MTRVEENIIECTDSETKEFDWEEYQYLCDLAITGIVRIKHE